MPKLKLDGVTLNYEIDDFTDPWLEKKPEVVLLHHGCGRHAGFWYRWVPVLSRKYVVIRIDARGFGKSSDPGPDFRWSIEAFANDVIALIDHLEIPQIYFVGEYMGAWTGMQFALDHPDRIKKLVFFSLPYFWPDAKRMVDTIERVGIEKWQLSENAWRFGRDRSYARWYAQELAKSRQHVVTSVIRAASAIDYRGRLSDIRCPVQVILGEWVVKEHYSDVIALMRERLPKSSEIVLLKGESFRGHYVHYIMPERCAKLTMKFFAEKSD